MLSIHLSNFLCVLITTIPIYYRKCKFKRYFLRLHIQSLSYYKTHSLNEESNPDFILVF